MGVNTLTAPASTWNRYVKAQFQNNTFEFDAISINGISVYGNGGSYSLSGLSPNTQYDAYVQNVCGANLVAFWTGPHTFSTPCLETPNYTEDFTTYLNSCWSEAQGLLGTTTNFTNTSSSSWSADGFGNVGSTGAARMNIYATGRDEWLISPSIDLTGGPFEFEYDVAFTEYANTLTANVGSDDSLVVVISPDNGATWSLANAVAVYDVVNNPSPAGVTEFFDLTAYSNTTIKIGFYAASSASNEDIDVFIDNFTVRTIPTCRKPSGLTAANITGSTADISWVAGATETAWNYEYGPTGFIQGSGTSAPLTSSSTTLTGLSPLTNYDIYIQADCGAGDLSDWTGPISFSTLPTPPLGLTCSTTGTSSGIIFSDDFESNVTSWTGDVNWEIVGGNGTASSNTGPDNSNIYSGVGIMNFEASNTSLTHTGSKYSPAIDLSNGAYDDAELSFWMLGYGASMGTFEVAVADTTTGSTYTTVFTTTGQTHSSGASPWWNVGANLSSYIGQVIYLKFTMIDDQGSFTGDMAVDLVEVTTCMTCPSPNALTATNITDSSANISWGGGSFNLSSYNVEYGPDGFTPGTGTTSIVTDSTASLTGLTADTQYDVYVQSDCGVSGGTSDTTALSFTTECELLTTFPYAMGFENGFGCWDVLDLNSANTWQLTAGTGVNATLAAQITYVITDAHDDHLISPKFSVTANSSRFSFNARNQSTAYPEKFDVLVSTTGKNGADFTDTLVSGAVPPTSYKFYQYDLSGYIGQNIYVSIHASEQDKWNLFVDDVTIDTYLSDTVTSNETACDSYTWPIDGNIYTSDTTITGFKPAIDVADADSTFNLNLIVNSSASSIDAYTACDSLVWYGNTYFTSNTTATTTLQTLLGCDSVVTLNLTVSNSYETT